MRIDTSARSFNPVPGGSGVAAIRISGALLSWSLRNLERMMPSESWPVYRHVAAKRA